MTADPTINDEVIYIEIVKGDKTYTFSVTGGAVAEYTDALPATEGEGATYTKTVKDGKIGSYTVPANTTVYTKKAA